MNSNLDLLLHIFKGIITWRFAKLTGKTSCEIGLAAKSNRISDFGYTKFLVKKQAGGFFEPDISDKFIYRLTRQCFNFNINQ